MNKTYNADREIINGLERMASKETVQIVIGAFLLLIGIIGGILMTWLLIVAVLALIFMVSSIALRSHFKAKARQYSSSYLRLNDRGIEGVSFRDESDLTGRPFSVEYRDVTSASGFEGEKINLTIKTKSGDYSCLGIENASEAAKRIMNNKMRLIEQEMEAKEERSRSVPADSGNAAPRPSNALKGQASGIIFCSKCGAKAPADSTYCPKCGELMI